MPRNGSSVYSLPAGNPVIPGTVIATTWANTTLTDIATALTNSLSTDGSTASVSLSGKTMTGGTFSGPAVTGTLNLTGGQIAFPAVAVPSANANTLDDYEEGTFTPTLTAATPGNINVAYSTRVGSYVKIGSLVSWTIAIVTSTFTWTTASGAINLTGLPFASLAAAGGYPVLISGLTSGSDQICPAQSSGATLLTLNGMEYSTPIAQSLSISVMPTGVQQTLTLSGQYTAT